MNPTLASAILFTGVALCALPAIAQNDAAPDTPSGETPAPTSDELLERARALFEAARGEECNGAAFGDEPPADVYAIPFRPSYAADDSPLEQATLIRFFCGAGAYNESHVYYLSTEVDGLRQMSFAEPELDIRYEDDGSENPVEDMRIIGFTSGATLVNSDFIADEQSIVSHSKWRGLGDASATGLWLFRDGRFTLVKYEVDATYDGEINPQTVLDYHTAP